MRVRLGIARDGRVSRGARIVRCAAVLAGGIAAASAPALAVEPAAQACGEWSAYRAFVDRFVQADGRVIDHSTATQQTTSEGQSYAMFFALVANDRATFDRLLAWTRTNLADNRFSGGSVRLPAWQWGRKADGTYGVLDPNAAADADLWIAYDLIEAGRLWRAAEYTALGTALAEQVAQHEVTTLPGFGAMLLPGPTGFVTDGTTRLNPSYLPLPVLRGLARALPNGPWAELARNALRMVKATAPQGYAPDWAAWRAGQFVVDPQHRDLGSYDAIRVYLWAGLASPADPLAKPWLAAVHGMGERVAQTGVPPEKVAVTNGIGTGEGPLSYWGALAPYFKARGDQRSLAGARAVLAALDGAPQGHEPVYYDRVMGLFGAGAIDGRYRFDANGALIPAWRATCE
ncbi:MULTISPECIES: cellulose synthase complex periplasmic endoglucanase BcsZ [Burkholderia]|uniref:cellulase n=1 Tax=Burkholderia paludis TaxID=1506587 RepID=A0A6J5DD46_9BURK|nr:MULTISPECIES: cellulose synthase complex periplasmic endoglucanase BcsZ [Burkholderia]CAB3752128.1 Endoglucanase [Burkholderia paludis]VWB49140.1 endo-1,4-D-glucanase [Burkholderia paludis]